MKSILVVDDDPQMRSALNEAIQRLGYSALIAENGRDALMKLDDIPVSMVVTDMKMPKMDGLSFMKEVRKKVGNLPILVITGFPTVENAVDAMKVGASDYLIKPFSFDALTRAIESLITQESYNTSREIITCCENIKTQIKLAARVAPTDMTVLILGESGTGKELFARYIHESSSRKEGPFIAVNCAAIPDNLLESELFGYEKGAFTGAAERKLGKFEFAHKGTILLDEIGEMTANLQAKLLRVLQEKEISRIGGGQPVSVDVRVIATTNRDLRRAIIEGKFREDLYYRLSVFPLQLPPLRERGEDIPLLAEHFAQKFSLQLNKHIVGFKDDTMEFLKTRQWKGNIRELENAIHRAVLLTKDEMMSIDDFLFEENVSIDSMQTKKIRDMEMEIILKTLKDTNGNKTRTARLLGLSVRTIRNKLNEYGKIFPTV